MTPKPKSVQASASGRIEPVKAWATAWTYGAFSGAFVGVHGCGRPNLYSTRKNAEEAVSRTPGISVVRVTITPVKQ